MRKKEGGFAMSADWKLAFQNVQAFLDESEVPMHVEEAKATTDNPGYYRFLLKSDKGIYQTLIDMPAVSLEELKNKETDVLEVPKVFVDGFAYRWDVALVKKATVKDFYLTHLAELENIAKTYRSYLVQL